MYRETAFFDGFQVRLKKNIVTTTILALILAPPDTTRNDLQTPDDRICLQCHTLSQVAVGAAVGSGTGALWYLLYSKVSLGLFRQNLFCVS